MEIFFLEKVNFSLLYKIEKIQIHKGVMVIYYYKIKKRYALQ